MVNLNLPGIKNLEDIPPQFSNENIGTFIVVSCILLVIETILLVLFTSKIYILLLAHFVISAALALLQFLEYRVSKPNFVIILFWSLYTIGSIFGLISILLISLFYKVFCHKGEQPDLSWLTHFDLEEDIAYEASKLIKSLPAHPTSSLVPFQVIMDIGNVNQKNIALGKISRNFTPLFAPLLLNALQDPNNGIRVHAATILVKINQHYLKQIIKLENKLQQYPNSAKLLLKLGTYYNLYAVNNTLDKNFKNAMLLKAIEFLNQYLKLNPSDLETHYYLGKLYLDTHQSQNAKKHFEHCLSYIQDNPYKLINYLNCLYTTGDLKKVKDLLHEKEPLYKKIDDPKILDIISLWEHA